MGVKRIILMNSWRVDRSFWESAKLSPDSLRGQSILGLEQGGDTLLPQIEFRRRFTPFVEDELPAIADETTALVAHPRAASECPRGVGGPVTLAIGPEGGFIENEIAMLQRAGLTPVHLGPRILRVEAAVPAILGRLF